jgi:hypothetical protein
MDFMDLILKFFGVHPDDSTQPQPWKVHKGI